MRVIAVLLFVFGVAKSEASDIREHRTVTHQAVQLFENCFPRKLSRFTKETLVYGNLEEDLNLVRKWVSFSHFYNPFKDVSTWRGSSFHRIQSLEETLTKWRNKIEVEYSTFNVRDALIKVGHVMHHVQDSTVPSHVVPIKHFVHDSFESYHGEQQDFSFSCMELSNSPDPLTNLHDSAQRTLRALPSKLTAIINGQSMELDWSYFWFDNGEKFGVYGEFGNNFGKTHFRMGAYDIQISKEIMDEFWSVQQRQSILQSAKVLTWFFSNLVESKREIMESVNKSFSGYDSDRAIRSLEKVLFE